MDERRDDPVSMRVAVRGTTGSRSEVNLAALVVVGGMEGGGGEKRSTLSDMTHNIKEAIMDYPPKRAKI